jgi:hypothetical protein
MAFVEAERTQLFLRCALFGPSGSGKTMTALRMAKGIAEKMGVRYAVIDTESRSASKYADRFHFVVDNLANKTVDGYIAAMHDAYRAGYKVLVIDSLSHAWRELTDEVDRITQSTASKNSWSAWGKVSPKQKKFIDAILNFPGHIIATMRSKTEWVIGEGKSGKLTPEKMGLAPEQGKGIEYEFDLLVELNQQHKAIVTKDRTGEFHDREIDKPGEDFGVALYDWISSGTPISSPTPATAPTTPTVPATASPPPAPPTTTQTPQAKEQPPAAPPPAQTPPASTTTKANVNKAGEAVIQEIANVITAKGDDDIPFFSEDEKEEARQLISSVSTDDKGVAELRDFRDFLSGLLDKRRIPAAQQTHHQETMRKAA